MAKGMNQLLRERLVYNEMMFFIVSCVFGIISTLIKHWILTHKKCHLSFKE